ncbi:MULTISPECIES: thioesterase II family protein [Brevibacillus]|uniref:thioesterase II family protein n=1 Tax=Brevibacillus TaxID=55080 RepID=UPI00156AC270|nr:MULTISPECIES: thioesterase [Brevibacillus]MDH6351834.1 medium-chain acyl-[acyl-carrier-protein] hydrolase [Brevibacillus sp. 1238]MED2253646.1 thioesterase domain-containing protein [Brevibacillus parabrevis]UED66637.1 thioesterase [Brevibacillus sp. HD3.3A]
MKLFCFPYAGGLPGIYYSWKSRLPPTFLEIDAFEVRPHIPQPNRDVFLPTSFYELLEDVCDRITPALAETPFAFFGHSMGGLVAFELTRKLMQKGALLPQHLFLSASRAPHAYGKLAKTYNLPHDEFVEALRKLGGTPDDVLENQELLELFLPILRADFQAVQTYEMNPDLPRQVPVNMTVLYGTEDTIALEDIWAWRDYCQGACQFFPVSGGHFFIHHQTSSILEIIQNVLKEEKTVAIHSSF